MRIIITAIILVSVYQLYGQGPGIEYASSHYKTTAGAIGPQGIISTHTYDLHIHSENTLILDGIIVEGFQIFGRNMIIAPKGDELMKLKLVVTTHQKQRVWYNAELSFNGITVPLEVIKKEREFDSDPAVILEVRSKRGLNRIIKYSFDSTSSVYNK